MITLDQAKWHLRIDGMQDDAELNMKITLASAIVQKYVGPLRGDHLPKTEAEELEAAAVDARRVDPDLVTAAELLVLGELWANREAGTSNLLSPNVTRLLDLMREPGVV